MMALSPPLRPAGLWSAALAALSVMAVSGMAMAGEEKWSPTVVSTVAGSPAGSGPSGAQGQPVRARVPQWADPRYVPKQIYTRQSGTLPDGAWSSIVTGAVPEGEGQGAQPAAPGAQPARSLRAASKRLSMPKRTGLKRRVPRAMPAALRARSRSRVCRPMPRPPSSTASTQPIALQMRAFAWQQKKIKDMEAELEKRPRCCKSARGIQNVACPP